MIQLTSDQKQEAFKVGSIILTNSSDQKGIICQLFVEVQKPVQEIVQIKGSPDEVINAVDIEYSELTELFLNPIDVLNLLYPLQGEKYVINQIPEIDNEGEYIFKKVNFND